MNQKAQGALEYLVLIGGAGLIVAIVLILIIASGSSAGCNFVQQQYREREAGLSPGDKPVYIDEFESFNNTKACGGEMSQTGVQYLGSGGRNGGAVEITAWGFIKFNDTKGVNSGPGGSCTSDPKRCGTVQMWVKPNWNAEAGHTFFDNGSIVLRTVLYNGVIWLHCTSRQSSFPYSPIVMESGTNNNARHDVSSLGTAWKAGEWHQIGCLWNAGDRDLLLDGQYYNGSGNMLMVSDRVYVGGLYSFQDSKVYESADAVIDKFKLYSYVRDWETEIIQDY